MADGYGGEESSNDFTGESLPESEPEVVDCPEAGDYPPDSDLTDEPDYDVVDTDDAGNADYDAVDARGAQDDSVDAADFPQDVPPEEPAYDVVDEPDEGFVAEPDDALETLSEPAADWEEDVTSAEEESQLDAAEAEPAPEDALPFETETELQIEEAVDAIGQIEELDPERWETLSLEERMEALCEIENRMAEIQGREPVEIQAEEMESNEFGGYQNGTITVNIDHLQSDMPVDEFIDTMVHEGRHAYQENAVNNPDLVENADVTDSWAENMDHYMSPEDYGQELYEAQPVEDDAHRYASQIRGGLIAANIGKGGE